MSRILPLQSSSWRAEYWRRSARPGRAASSATTYCRSRSMARWARRSAVCIGALCSPLIATPKPFFDPERPQPMVFDEQWQEMPDVEPARNGYRAGWELFLKHVAEDAPFPSSFIE